MPGPDLLKLYRLHVVDAAIAEIRAKAAGMDPGRALGEEIKKLAADHDRLDTEAKRLGGDLNDQELLQKSIADKLKKIDTELYGGKIVNPKEVAAFQKEIEILKRQSAEADSKILALWEVVPPAREAAEKVEKELNIRKQQLAQHQQTLVKLKQQLEADFKARNAERMEHLKEVNPNLLKQYESVKERNGGIGMAEITRAGTCGMCGMTLPVKTVEMAKEGKIVTCESCHRILIRVLE
jgi:predicted  nucleic acid-binding Zn-ribbon protein